MDKIIHVKACFSCPYCVPILDDAEIDFDERCDLTHQPVRPTDRPNCCPLSDLPAEMEINGNNPLWALGWNACLTEIKRKT